MEEKKENIIELSYLPHEIISMILNEINNTCQSKRKLARFFIRFYDNSFIKSKIIFACKV